MNRTLWVRNEPVDEVPLRRSWQQLPREPSRFWGLLGGVCPWGWACPHAEGSDSSALLSSGALAGCRKGAASGGQPSDHPPGRGRLGARRGQGVCDSHRS